MRGLPSGTEPSTPDGGMETGEGGTAEGGPDDSPELLVLGMVGGGLSPRGVWCWLDAGRAGGATERSDATSYRGIRCKLASSLAAAMARWAVVIGLLFLVAVARCGGSGSQAVGADPVRIRIPAIGVDAPVQPLIVDRNGVLPPPDTYDRAGWWREAQNPGNADQQ